MQSKLLRTLAAALGISALLIALIAAHPATTSAANLTGGNYTYVIDGEEVTFMFDPVVRKEGLLLPTEVFTEFGIKLDGTSTREISMTKDDLIAKVTVGSTQVNLAGQTKALATAPLRLNGRVFLPADLLKEFGVDFAQDGTMIFMRQLVEKMPEAKKLTDEEWGAFKTARGFTTNLRSDSNIYLITDMMLLNKEMVNTTNIGVSYGMRARLHQLMETNTLVLVRLTNPGNKAGGMQTAGTYLVDDLHNQYDVAQVIDIGEGLLNAKLVPNAERWGVLAFPKLPASVTKLTVYYDANTGIVGTFPVTQ